MSNNTPVTPFPSIHSASESYRIGIEQIVKDLYPAIEKEDGIKIPTAAYRPIAEELASDLKHLGVAPTDFSLTRWLGEFGISALRELLDEYDRDQSFTVAVTEIENSNLYIEDAGNRHIILSHNNAMHLAQMITGHYAERIDRPRPGAAA